MIEVQFEIKSEIKSVSVDFYLPNYNFINHLKRAVLNQIRGSVQKEIALHLINENQYTVIENGVVLFDKQTTSNTVISNVNNSIELSNIESSNIESNTVDSNIVEPADITAICHRLDELETETEFLMARLMDILDYDIKTLESNLQTV